MRRRRKFGKANGRTGDVDKLELGGEIGSAARWFCFVLLAVGGV